MGHAKLSDINVVGERIEHVRRRFLRSSEDDQTHADGLRILCTEGTCTGCRNAVGSAVFDMKSAGWASYLKDVAIITGPDAVIPDGTNADKLVAVGVCVPPGLRGVRYARGCPPSNIWITAAIMGKDYVPSKTEHLDGKLDE